MAQAEGPRGALRGLVDCRMKALPGILGRESVKRLKRPVMSPEGGRAAASFYGGTSHVPNSQFLITRNLTGTRWGHSSARRESVFRNSQSNRKRRRSAKQPEPLCSHTCEGVGDAEYHRKQRSLEPCPQFAEELWAGLACFG